VTVIPVIGIIAVFLFPLALFSAWKLIYDYQITSTGIQLLLFRSIPVFQINFSNIETAYTSTWLKVYAGRLDICFLPNRIFVSKVLLIERRKGIIRRILITPEEPDQFLRQIQEAKGG
jgi:hypothetical protein